jgi:hypothetical protein
MYPGLVSTMTPFGNDHDGIGVDRSACPSAGNEAPRLMLQMIHWQPCTLGTLKHLVVLFLIFDSHLGSATDPKLPPGSRSPAQSTSHEGSSKIPPGSPFPGLCGKKKGDTSGLRGKKKRGSCSHHTLFRVTPQRNFLDLKPIFSGTLIPASNPSFLVSGVQRLRLPARFIYLQSFSKPPPRRLHGTGNSFARKEAAWLDSFWSNPSPSSPPSPDSGPSRLSPSC